MKYWIKTLLLLGFSLPFVILHAQDKANADSLIKQGIQLGHNGKYAEAIAKFNEALKVDPDNLEAEYETGYNLYASGNGNDAVAHLEKVIRLNPSSGGTYDLLGTIFDEEKQPEKAIEIYQQGIKANPDYQRLHFNLGVAYLGQKKYSDAESCAIDAIKLDPMHVSSHKLFAMANYYQNRNSCAIIALCNFLLIEPQGERAAAIFKSLQQILQSGVSKNDKGGVNITYNVNKGGDNDIGAADLMTSILNAASLQKDKSLTPYETFASQIQSIISVTGEMSEKKTDKSFFWKYYADYFYQLYKSGNMAAFTRVISQTAFKDEYAQWLKDNAAKVDDLNNWVKATERRF